MQSCFERQPPVDVLVLVFELELERGAALPHGDVEAALFFVIEIVDLQTVGRDMEARSVSGRGVQKGWANAGHGGKGVVCASLGTVVRRASALPRDGYKSEVLGRRSL